MQPEPEYNEFQNKSKNFCWMISNCEKVFSQSRYKIAEALIGALSSKVHIWGNAVRDKCVNGTHKNIENHGPVDGLHQNYYDEA